jgi:hypothetical protein
LKDLSEEEIKKAIQSEDCGPKDYLMLVKMLCAKKGMPLKVWEEIFHEQELKQTLRQRGVHEDIVADIVACWVRVLLEGGSNPGLYEGSSRPGYFLNSDKQRKLTCAVCPREPYKALSIEAGHITGKIGKVFVTVLCKDHFKRVKNNDGKLIEAIVDTVRQHKV